MKLTESIKNKVRECIFFPVEGLTIKQIKKILQSYDLYVPENTLKEKTLRFALYLLSQEGYLTEELQGKFYIYKTNNIPKLSMKRRREKVIGKDMVCPYCYSDDVKGIGKYFTQYKGIRQRYICKVCKKTFYLD